MRLDIPTDLNELRLTTLTRAVRSASDWMLRASIPTAIDDPDCSVALLRASKRLRSVIAKNRRMRGAADQRFRQVLAQLDLARCEMRARALLEGPRSGDAIAFELIDPIVRDAPRAPRWLRRYRAPAV